MDNIIQKMKFRTLEYTNNITNLTLINGFAEKLYRRKMLCENCEENME